MLSFSEARRLLLQPGCRLVRTNIGRRAEYEVTPGAGVVSEHVAQRLLAALKELDCGLFRDTPQ
jgi:hypothetical protein